MQVVGMNVHEKVWLKMNPKGVPSNDLDKDIHLQEGNVALRGFMSGRTVFARFGVHDNRPLTDCSRVV